MKRTYQPSKLIRKRRHGFRARMATVGGRKVIASRRAKGRKRLSAEAPQAVAVARLKRRPEFLAVAASGLKVATPGIIVQARRRGDHEASRLGLTASRKIGGAVERNRARRRLRAAAETAIPLAGGVGHDYVLVARAAALTRPYALLVEDLARALARISQTHVGSDGLPRSQVRKGAKSV